MSDQPPSGGQGEDKSPEEAMPESPPESPGGGTSIPPSSENMQPASGAGMSEPDPSATIRMSESSAPPPMGGLTPPPEGGASPGGRTLVAGGNQSALQDRLDRRLVALAQLLLKIHKRWPAVLQPRPQLASKRLPPNKL